MQLRLSYNLYDDDAKDFTNIPGRTRYINIAHMLLYGWMAAVASQWFSSREPIPYKIFVVIAMEQKPRYTTHQV